MKRLLLALALAALVAWPLRAQEGETKLTLGGVWVLQFRASAGGFTPEQRLSALQDRVVDLLSRPDLQPKDVRVVPGPGGRSAAVYAGPLLLVTATEADAAANQSTPLKLANVWAENLRRAFRAARPLPVQPE